MGLRHPVPLGTGDTCHGFIGTLDFLAGVLDDELHAFEILQRRNRGGPFVEILPHDTHRHNLRK